MVENGPLNEVDNMGKEPFTVGACCAVIGAAYICYQAYQDIVCQEERDQWVFECELRELSAKLACEPEGTYTPGVVQSMTCRSYGRSMPCGGGTCTPIVPTPEP